MLFKNFLCKIYFITTFFSNVSHPISSFFSFKHNLPLNPKHFLTCVSKPLTSLKLMMDMCLEGFTQAIIGSTSQLQSESRFRKYSSTLIKIFGWFNLARIISFIVGIGRLVFFTLNRNITQKWLPIKNLK